MKTTHKAKRVDNKKWIEGFFIEIGNNCYIVERASHVLLVMTRGYKKTLEDQILNKRTHLVYGNTLCERVRGTDFFNGDILLVDISKISKEFPNPFYAELFWCEDETIHYGWSLRDISNDRVLEFLPMYIKQNTGRNLHDND